MASRRVGLALVLLLLLPQLARAATPPRGGGCEAGAYLARWRAGAIGRTVSGNACWIVGKAGELRLEASLDTGGEDRPAENLFYQQGQGWSLILGQPGEGTFNPWAEAWQEVHPGLEAWMRAALLCPGRRSDSATSRGTAYRPRFCRPTQPMSVYRWVAPRLTFGGRDQTDSDSGRTGRFRQSMVRRGTGRGADREIARLEVFHPAPRVAGWIAGTRLRLVSSRRPGYLEWTILQRSPGFEAPPEAFLPLWPLSEFVDPVRVFPGTR